MDEKIIEKAIEEIEKRKVCAHIEYQPIVKIQITHGIYEEYSLSEGFDKLFGIGSFNKLINNGTIMEENRKGTTIKKNIDEKTQN